MPTLSFLLVSLLLTLGLAMQSAWGGERPFVVITAPDVTEHHLSRESVFLIFKRKQNHWESGKRIQPVNLPTSHPLRRAFSQTLLGQAPEAMEDYWRERYFHGVLPPHVVESEEAVILFVASTPGAIGYLSACPTDRKVNVVLTVGDVPNCPR